MKNFKTKIFVICTVVFGLLTFISFVTAFANEEGTISPNISVTALTNLFYVLRFPSHTLFPPLVENGWGSFFGGLVLNCLFYGIVTERLIYLSTKLRTKTNS